MAFIRVRSSFLVGLLVASLACPAILASSLADGLAEVGRAVACSGTGCSHHSAPKPQDGDPDRVASICDDLMDAGDEEGGKPHALPSDSNKGLEFLALATRECVSSLAGTTALCTGSPPFRLRC